MSIQKMLKQLTENQSKMNVDHLSIRTQLEKLAPQRPLYEMSSISMTPHKTTEIYSPPSAKEINDYQSASVFIEALAKSALEWKQNIPEDCTPAILAVFSSGIQISVETLSQVSFHGIRVDGTLNGNPCSMLTHQAAVQILCFAEKIEEEKPRNTIGFVWPSNRVEI